ncbi:PREDICTED: uncharacterized protein LOC108366491 [Rhagoletis zephyria]|uniref:uncharacterized protein LOC108366491 n=1 Tax=Rhagoletis zephyria TaxID=28612 RepID=UPI0008112CE1|nr:PREDICTED: uncharacterized protein LOC108366491 [Rhagoletis zephyria]
MTTIAISNKRMLISFWSAAQISIQLTPSKTTTTTTTETGNNWRLQNNERHVRPVASSRRVCRRVRFVERIVGALLISGRHIGENTSDRQHLNAVLVVYLTRR